MSDSNQSDADQSNDQSGADPSATQNAPSGFEGRADGYINSTLENVAGRVPGGDGFVKGAEAEVDSRANAFIEEEEKNLPGGLGSMFGGDKQ